MKKGLIQVYTGDGKGKTTAALGLALRAVGHGMNVLMIQFMKGKSAIGEYKAAQKLAPCLTILPMGRETFVSKDNPDPKDIQIAREGFLLAQDAIQNKQYDVVILDEINVAVEYGLISFSDLLHLLNSKPEEVEIVLTGRNARPELLERADLVTEMVKRKHYFDEGVPARKGMED
jgi:cob(I)alamin adenosyltransferase